MKKYFLLTLLIATIAGPLAALDPNNVPLPELDRQFSRKALNVPDIMGYKTLKGDFHCHTIFSDGVVWPSVRILEAWADGLDAIAITDHIENNPGKQNVSGDDNSAYGIAASTAAEKDILLVHAGELSRDMPPGHYNALFVTDTNKLDKAKEDFLPAVEEANKQGAYVQWNHPGWKAQQPDVTNWQPIMDELIAKGWVHGIEVFNSSEWYPVALGWCMDKNLSPMANSDMHGIVMQQYDTLGGQRPMTLVFAQERTLDSLREAMFAHRTVAWFGENLAGKSEFLDAMFHASVSAAAPFFTDKKGNRSLTLTNTSDIVVLISGAGDDWRGSVRLPARSSDIIKIKGEPRSIAVNVTNFHTGLNQTLTTNLDIPAK